MTNHEIERKLSVLVREERRITNEILELLCLAMDRRTYLELGFSSMFDWLVKGFGYSGSAAYRRIEAARILKAVPETSEKLENGSVNLSTLAKAQTVIRQQEKISGKHLSAHAKSEVIRSIENKTAIETEQTLISIFPDVASEIKQERHTVINDKEIRHQMNLSNEATRNLLRAKEVLSHKFPNASDAEIVTYALEFLLEKIDPLRRPRKESKPEPIPKAMTEIKDEVKDAIKAKVTAASEVKPSGKTIRAHIVKEAHGKCTYHDPLSGRRCESSYQVQLDHIIPKALGGSDDPDNLRLLCRQHNLLMAEKIFGKPLMNRYRNSYTP